MISSKCLANSSPLLKNRRLKSTALPLPDIVSLLKQCSNLKRLQQTHGFLVPRGLHQDKLLLTPFLHVCFSLGFSRYAYSLFTQISFQPEIYLYNTMIKALSPADAVYLFGKIRLTGLRPDTYSFPFVLKAVVRLSAIHVGRQIHCQAIVTGLDSDVHVVTALLQVYSSFGRGYISDARKLFDGVRFSDVAMWNAMVAGYAKVGDVDNARELFERMPQRNVISWTAVIAGYAQMNRPNDAIALFRRMQVQDVEPDEIAMLALLSASAQLGALDLGEWIHNYIHRHGLNKTVPLNNALIDMYAKSGNIRKALQMFENMKHKSVITWTTMIAGLALHGLGREALEIFSRMERARVKPNEITFIAILSACSHVGLVDLGRWYFNVMKSRYGIEPKIEHYGCMIDLLGRAGYVQEAQQLLRGMPFEANAAIWGSLLAASNSHGDAELGERALQNLIKLEPRNSGNYALLSNIYAAHGRWNESRMVRKVMRDMGVKKIAGGSYIEVSNVIHEFIAGDASHLQSDRIYEIVCNINKQLKIAEHLHE